MILEDVMRLYIAGRLARASASAASAAANAVRASHPALATRAARAACIAMTASSNATITRSKLRGALTEIRDLSLTNVHGIHMRKWLTMLEFFRSKTAQFEFGACMAESESCLYIERASDSAKSAKIHSVVCIRSGKQMCRGEILLHYFPLLE